jgi:hypothetical protein
MRRSGAIPSGTSRWSLAWGVIQNDDYASGKIGCPAERPSGNYAGYSGGDRRTACPTKKWYEEQFFAICGVSRVRFHNFHKWGDRTPRLKRRDPNCDPARDFGQKCPSLLYSVVKEPNAFSIANPSYTRRTPDLVVGDT